MALKREYEKKSDIPKGAEEHYNEIDGKWVLDSDHEDTGALKRAKDHEAKERKRLEAELKAAKEANDAVQSELDDVRRGAIPKGDVEKLELSYKAKLDKANADASEKITKRDTALQKVLRENVARALATEISTAPELMLPHILGRLSVAEVDGEFVTQVIGSDGKPSALSTDDLKKEMLQNKNFAPILVGSRASGGGANGGQGGGGASNGGNKFDAASASARDLVAHLDKKSA